MAAGPRRKTKDGHGQSPRPDAIGFASAQQTALAPPEGLLVAGLFLQSPDHVFIFIIDPQRPPPCGLLICGDVQHPPVAVTRCRASLNP